MIRRLGYTPGPPRRRRHYAYAVLTDAEHAVIKTLATKDGLSMSDFVRRCVNSYLLELGDDIPLLVEKEQAPRRATRPGGDVPRGTPDTVGPVGPSDLSGVSRHD